jgi:hypothetical protein
MDIPALVRIAFVLVVTAVAVGWLAWERSRKPRRVVMLTTDGFQEATIVVRNGYHPETIRVRAGQPVRLVFQRLDDRPCSSRVYLAEPPLSRYLPPFVATAIVFTPSRIGTFLFTCEEGRYRGRIIVEPHTRPSRLLQDSQDPLSVASAVRAMLGAKRLAERHRAMLEGIRWNSQSVMSTEDMAMFSSPCSSAAGSCSLGSRCCHRLAPAGVFRSSRSPSFSARS